MKNNKGFTLIELLIVIMIIGILSSIILASLNQSRRKGADSKTKSTLVSLRSQAELYFNAQIPNSYGTAASDACNANLFADTIAANILASLITPTCRSSATGYSVSAPLVSVTGHWCVDSTGASKVIGATLASGDISC